VIYGLSNKGGIAFANFLAKRGFSIILIDKEKEKLEICYKYVKDHLTEAEFNNIEVMKTSIEIFDKTML